MWSVGVAVLDRTLYSMQEAAWLLDVPTATLRNWIDGYERRGKRYPPVVREEPTGVDVVTWGEFVEASYLAEFRRKHNVPLQHIRPVVDGLRQHYGTPYPLAHFKPFAADRELVFDLQEDAGLAPRLQLLVYRSGQLMFSDPTESYLRKVEFEPGGSEAAMRIRPDGRESPVFIDPQVAFGIPVVRSTRTENLFELFEAGDSIMMIAANYDLPREHVEAAIRFEARRLGRKPDEVSEAA